ncbi:MAG TPA: D-alanine--D-alanine ligase, partial [Leptospiraceae bacterium]|nr:D-alanine--D-alanine ligase [Leptospiraceae bacterium]
AKRQSLFTMTSRSVFLVADIYESFPELDSNLKQEWENQKSIDYLKETILNLGYNCSILEPKKSKIDFLTSLQKLFADKSKIENCILFNLVEGYNSRNREAYIPALSEMLGIPFAGSDAYAQCISLDKFLTKQVVKSLNIQMKESYYIEDTSNIPVNLHYPLFIKPNSEGSSLGIQSDNIVSSRQNLIHKLKQLLKEYSSVLMEPYLSGSDYTLGIIGNYPNYKVTKVAEVKYPAIVYDSEIKTKDSMPEKLYFTMNSNLEAKIQRDSVEICKRIKVNGYARIDWKSDEKGNPFFLEVNLTPGLSAFYSALPICYENSFGNYSDLIKNILQFGYEHYNTSKNFGYGRYEKN